MCSADGRVGEEAPENKAAIRRHDNVETIRNIGTARSELLHYSEIKSCNEQYAQAGQSCDGHNAQASGKCPITGTEPAVIFFERSKNIPFAVGHDLLPRSNSTAGL